MPLMIRAITRKVRAPCGPPISAPITTSRPPREASRIVVRSVALKVDCLVVFIAEVLLVEECGRRSIAADGRIEHRGWPLSGAGGLPRDVGQSLGRGEGAPSLTNCGEVRSGSPSPLPRSACFSPA